MPPCPIRKVYLYAVLVVVNRIIWIRYAELAMATFYLCKEYEFIIPDWRGFGGSKKFPIKMLYQVTGKMLLI